MTLVTIILTIMFSVAIGLFMGIIGGGGGGVYVVVLMLLFHQSAKAAAITALVLSTVTLSGAAFEYLRKKQFQKDYFFLLSTLDVAGTLLGAALLGFIREDALKIVILAVLALSGISSLLKIKSSEAGNITPVKKKWSVASAVGLASGVITGTTGLSAATMLSSFLIGLLDFPPFLAVGTTTLVSFAGNLISIGILCLGSLMFHSPVMHIDPQILLTFGIGSAAGGLFGAKLTSKINRKVLTVILAAMAVLPGIYLALKK